MKKITRSLLALLLVVALVVPNFLALANAATHDDNIEAIDEVVMNDEYIATAPNDAKWFFDANGEVASFGTADIDVYRNDLPTNSASAAVNNDLTLYSSTDGGIYNLPNMIYAQYGSPKNPGLFSINWESGYYADWENTTIVPAGTVYTASADVPQLSTLYGNGYTDGTYTLVGWGGDFQPGVAKNELTIRLKDSGDGTLSDALSHLTIYLVGPYGAIYDKIWVKSADGTDNGQTNCLYLVDLDGDGDYLDEDGNYTFRAKLNGSVYAQGIKLAFDHVAASEGSDTSLRHSGTLLVAQVEIACGDSNTYNDFSPIKYYAAADDSVIENYMQDPLDANYLPFIRAKTNNTGTAEGATSGANISNAEGYTWHNWTMSTSDANIVNNHTSKIDALQIKYRNDTVNMSSSGYKSHQTYTELTGTKDLNAHWLVMTLGTAQVDSDILKLQVQLIDKDGNERIVTLSEFVMGTEATASGIYPDYIAGTYRTVYYDLTKLQDFNGFRSIRFLFDGMADGKDANGIRNSRYFYLTEVYLIGEGASVHKEVDKTSVSVGEELTYTITVTNNGTLDLSNYTVTDRLPDGFEFASVSSTTGSSFTYAVTDGQLTLNGTNLAIGQIATYQVKGTVKSGTSNGAVLRNSAVITQLNDEIVTIRSNEVLTTVMANEFVFYAEVGQQTTLDFGEASVIIPGTTAPSGTATDHAVGTQTVPSGTNGNGWAHANPTNSLQAVNFGTYTLSYSSDRTVKFVVSLQNPVGSQVGADVGKIVLTNTATNASYTLKPGDADVAISNCSLCSSGCAGTENHHVGNTNVNSTVTYTFNALPAGSYNVQVYAITGNANGSSDWVGTQIVLKANYEDDVTGNPTIATGKIVPESVSGFNNGGSAVVSDGKLLYTPTIVGKESFTMAYHMENDSTKAGNVTVTVFNFDVKDHLYVLDYGLPVDLAGGDPTTFAGINESVLEAAQSQLINQNIGVTFIGVSSTALKDGDSKNVDEYKVANNSETVNDYIITAELAADGDNGGLSAQYNAQTSDLKVTYTPNRFLDSRDTLYYGVQVSINDTETPDLNSTTATPVMQGKIEVIPASVVYYEDNFAASNAMNNANFAADGDNGIIYGGGTIEVSPATDSTQSNDLNMQYGYDPAYADDAMFSDGSATTLPGGAWAMFKFKGTGFDVVSHTATDTGTIMAFVYDAEKVKINSTTGRLESTTDGVTYVKPVSIVSVDTYYENDGTDGLYQIPVISWTSPDNTYGTYIVRLAISTKKVDGESAARPVEIDGIRIYNPGGTKDEPVAGVYSEYIDVNSDALDETSLVFKEVRALVLGEDFQYNEEDPLSSTSGTAQASLVSYEKASDGSVVFLTGATVTENFTGAYFGGTPSSSEQYTADLLNYAIQGPNNELYLSNNYAVAFVVEGLTDADSIQIGMKAISGKPVLACYTGDGWAKLVTENADGTQSTDGKLATATEMYYKLPLASCYEPETGKYLVILRVDAGTDDIISLTNLKIDKDAKISAPSDDLKQGIADETLIATMDNVLVGKNGYSVMDYEDADKFITFATNTTVVSVEVTDANGNVLTAVTSSYLFQDANTKTWTVHYDPEIEDYTVWVLTNTCKYEVNPATN